MVSGGRALGTWCRLIVHCRRPVGGARFLRPKPSATARKLFYSILSRIPTESIARVCDRTVFWEARLGKFAPRALLMSTVHHCKGEQAARAANAAPRRLGRVRGSSVAARGTTAAVRGAYSQRRRSYKLHCLG